MFSGGKIPHGKKGLAIGAMILAVFGYSQRSINNINEVREPLQIVAVCAKQELNPPLTMVIVDGGRTLEEHKINVANGKSWIKRSRHQDGAAIDVAAAIASTNDPTIFKISYDPTLYYQLNDAFNKCAQRHNIQLIWGGTWKVKDLMHWELDKRFYP